MDPQLAKLCEILETIAKVIECEDFATDPQARAEVARTARATVATVRGVPSSPAEIN